MNCPTCKLESIATIAGQLAYLREWQDRDPIDFMCAEHQSSANRTRKTRDIAVKAGVYDGLDAESLELSMDNDPLTPAGERR